MTTASADPLAAPGGLVGALLDIALLRLRCSLLGRPPRFGLDALVTSSCLGRSTGPGAAAPFHRTRCHCCDCGVLHDADLREVDGAVFLEVHCPRGTGTALVSTDAATFRRVRDRAALPAGTPPVARGVTWVNILEITRECNLACPICFAGSRPGAGGFLSVDEVRRTARALRAQGLLAVSLSGGEPTLHPQLEEIVRAVRDEGLDATLLSNGLRLGE